MPTSTRPTSTFDTICLSNSFKETTFKITQFISTLLDLLRGKPIDVCCTTTKNLFSDTVTTYKSENILIRMCIEGIGKKDKEKQTYFLDIRIGSQFNNLLRNVRNVVPSVSGNNPDLNS